MTICPCRLLLFVYKKMQFLGIWPSAWSSESRTINFELFWSRLNFKLPKVIPFWFSKFGSKTQKKKKAYDKHDENITFFESPQIDPGLLGGGSRHQMTSKQMPGVTPEPLPMLKVEIIGSENDRNIWRLWRKYEILEIISNRPRISCPGHQIKS